MFVSGMADTLRERPPFRSFQDLCEDIREALDEDIGGGPADYHAYRAVADGGDGSVTGGIL